MRLILPNMHSDAPRKIPFAAWAASLALLTLFSLFTHLALAAQLTDTTPPVLTGFNFSPGSVDVTNGDATVDVTLHVTDDLSGFSSAYVQLYSPSYGQEISTFNVQLTSGTVLDGDAQGTLTIPQLSEAGDWSVYWIDLRDATGNSQVLDKATLMSLGFPTTLTVISQDQDVTPPQLNSFNISPTSIDVSSGPQSTTFTMGITDDKSGLNFCQGSVCYITIRLQSPSGKQSQQETGRNVQLLSGTLQNGVWQVVVTLPRYAEAGVWKVNYLYLLDMTGNSVYLNAANLQSRGFPSTLTVTSSISDTQAPQLTSLTFAPNFVDTTTGWKTIALTIGATDNLSGVDVAQHYDQSPNLFALYPFRFSSPSGGQNLSVYPRNSLAGTAINGTWQGTGYLPQYSEAGTWNLYEANLTDAAGNRVTYDNVQLKAMGFPTTLEVVLPSLVSDGTISDPTTGGTVQDDVFPERAQVIVPAGVLNQAATVSIDVLSSDLNLPIPAGFTTNGTRFVNITLDPEPTPPFPAPGLTLVLPLLNQMEPGTQLTLYRVDPVSGNLTPEPGIGGGLVVGTVDPSGLSATFTGVAALSTVVGLIPSGDVLGDLDGDGQVDCADIAIVRASFGKRVNESEFDSRADTNHDNVINIRDLAFVSRNLASGVVCRITPTGAIPASGPLSFQSSN